MGNLLHADFYRVRKSAGTRNSLIGLAAVLIFSLSMLFLTNSSAMQSVVSAQNSGTAVEISQDLKEMQGFTSQALATSASFGLEMMEGNVLLLFFLPFILIVFGADFSAQTYRNTLSYESNRLKVYFAKLLLGIACGVVVVLFNLLFSWLLGGIFLGFTGFTAAYFAQVGTTLLLQLPVYICVISFGFCVVAFARSSGGTVAVYLLSLLGLGIATQLLLVIFPQMQWLMLLDWLNLTKVMAAYQTMPGSLVVGGLLMAAGMTVLTSALGAYRFSKCDLA